MIDRPVFVNSIPKSGTYLLAAILQELGIEFTHWHVFETFYDDYTDVPLEIARAHSERFRIRQPVGRTISQLRPGQFAVGHLPYNERTREALRHCFVIFLKRDLRECLVSHMRWQAATGRDRSAWTRITDPKQRLLAYLSKWGRNLTKRAYAVALWEPLANETLRFDDLHDDVAIQRLSAVLGVAFNTGVTVRVRSTPSLTRMVPAAEPVVWDAEVEQRLLELTTCIHDRAEAPNRPSVIN